MTSIPLDAPGSGDAPPDRTPSIPRAELWPYAAIGAMWLAVIVEAALGHTIVSTPAEGQRTTVPSAVALAPFALAGTWIVARHGGRCRSRD